MMLSWNLRVERTRFRRDLKIKMRCCRFLAVGSTIRRANQDFKKSSECTGNTKMQLHGASQE
jgi:hypothetical protein